jgi:3-hydroxybutyryl-CoA dehydrogenase
MDRAIERGKLTREQADAALARLQFSTSLSEAAGTDVVIEAIPERLDLKIQLVGQLDSMTPATTVLASNTSGFSIAAIGAASKYPDRVIGWHWASPAPVMRFAEIVRTPTTSSETIERVCEIAKACGKNPIVVNDIDTNWGFVANRIYAAVIDEAKRVVEDDVATPEQVDQLMTDCFAWPAGPYAMIRGATEGWA